MRRLPKIEASIRGISMEKDMLSLPSDQLDKEWIDLILMAFEIGLDIQEIRQYLQQHHL